MVSAFVCCLHSAGPLEPACAEIHGDRPFGGPDKFIATGRVTNIAGQVIAGATIEWWRGGTRFQRGIRVGTGGNGTYRLFAEVARGSQLACRETVTVKLGEDLGPICIRGKAEPCVTIYFAPRFRWDCTQFTTWYDTAGEYEIGGLRAGRYSAFLYSLNSTGYFWHRLQKIVVKNDIQHVDLLPKPVGTNTATPAGDSATKK